MTLIWGILSTANIGRKVVTPAIQASAGSEVVAVASRDKRQAERYAEELSIPEHYGSYEALLENPEITAIYNPLPNSLHLPWTLRALESGKHVLCEKPLGLTAAECRQMAQAAESSGVVLMEAFMYRFHDRTQKLFELVQDGTFGTVRLIRARFAFTVADSQNIRLSATLGGGSLMDVGCYCVNVVRSLAGGQPNAVQASATWKQDVDETLAATLEFENGLTAQIDCALNQPRYERVELFGTEGFCEVESAFLPGSDETNLEYTTRQAGVTQLAFPAQNQYQKMVEHFAQCVIQGRSPQYGALEAAQNMAVIEALYALARQQGARVSLSNRG